LSLFIVFNYEVKRQC